MALKDLIFNLLSSKLKKIHRFNGIHKGEACYLIGDGVSLKYFDLHAFDDKIAIPLGFLPFHLDFDKLIVPYALLIETYYFYPFSVLTSAQANNSNGKIIVNKIQSQYKEIMRDREETEFFLNLSNYPVTVNYDNITYFFKDIPDLSLNKDFISRKFNCFEGSLRASILLAIYMGFDHVYLVGHDYTHSPSMSLHWYEAGKGIVTDAIGFNEDFLDEAKKYIDITTVTVESISETLDYIRYEDLTGYRPTFKENNELMSEKYLDVMASWPGYRIY